MVEKLK